MNAFAPVLVAVESLTLRMHTAEVLGAAGLQALLAANREEALAGLAASGLPSALILAEGGFGLEVLELVRKVNPETPLVVLGDPKRSEKKPDLDSFSGLSLKRMHFLDPANIRDKLADKLGELIDSSGEQGKISPLKHVLAVDDSRTFLHQTSLSLSQLGYEMSIARSGEEALKHLDEGSQTGQLPDAILLDMLMPGMSGNETSRRIKRNPLWRNIPIIVLTGQDEPEAISEALNAGADDFVAKSSDNTVLKARLQAQLRRKASEDESQLIREQLLESQLEVVRARADRKLAQTRARLLSDLEVKNEELQHEKERAETILESITDAFIAVDSQWRLQYQNGEAQRLLGQEKRPNIGRVLWNVLPQLAGGKFQSELDKAMEQRQELEFEVEVEALGAWFEVRVFPAAEGLSIYFRDVSVRRRITENRMLLLEASKQLAHSLDFERTLELVSRQLLGDFADTCTVFIDSPDYGQRQVLALARRELEEWARKQVKGLSKLPERDGPIREAMKKQRAQYFSFALSQGDALSVGAKLAIKLKLRHFLAVPLIASGQTFGALVASSSTRNYDSEDLAFAQEFAGRAAFSLENSRLYRESQQAVQLRDEFLAVASHELRTPLTTLRLLIQGQIRRLQKQNGQPVPSATVLRQLERADAQSSRLGGLVENLLDITRLSSGGLELSRQEIDLAALTKEIVSRHQEELQRAHCKLSLDADSPVLGFWDGDRLDQVITNLLSNAIKYGSGAEISIRVHQSAEDACVQVSDKGIGIAPEDQENIFERFARGVSEQHYGGLGLGLWIACHIVQAHGGTIEVKSERGIGSTFTVTLPKEWDEPLPLGSEHGVVESADERRGLGDLPIP